MILSHLVDTAVDGAALYCRCIHFPSKTTDAFSAQSETPQKG